MSTGNELKKVVFYLPESIKEDLREIAEADGRKMANWVAHLVKSTVEERMGGQAPTPVVTQPKKVVKTKNTEVKTTKDEDKNVADVNEVLNSAKGWV